MNIEYVLKSRYQRAKNVDAKLKKGFCHLIGTAMVQNGIYASHQLPPHPYFKDSAVVGVVKLNVEAEKIDYVCQKRTSLLDNNRSNNNNNNNNNNDNSTQFSYVSSYTFYSNGCTKTAQTKGTSVCSSCANKKDTFKRRLLREYQLRGGPLDTKVNNGRFIG